MSFIQAKYLDSCSDSSRVIRACLKFSFLGLILMCSSCSCVKEPQSCEAPPSSSGPGVSLVSGSADGSGASQISNPSATSISLSPSSGQAWNSFFINLGSDFLAENICSGKIIFGRSGSAFCDLVFGDLIYSMGHRKDSSTVDFTDIPSLSSRVVATIRQEAIGANDFVTNYDLVPKPKYDTDGLADAYGVGAKRYFLETIVGGRPTVTCGTTQATIEERIEDCASKNGNKAFYDGKKYGATGEGDWKLVVRTSTGKEVWRDERTRLLWSDRIGSFNWYRAAGYAWPTDTSGPETGFDASVGGTYQSNPPVSACAEPSLIAGLRGVATYVSPAGSNDPKGNLSVSSTPAVVWRLPTIDDFKLADVNGMRKVLPNGENWYWSSTSSAQMISTANQAYRHHGGYGSVGGVGRDSSLSVRCVGRGE